MPVEQLRCPHCPMICAGINGLDAHIHSMHRDMVEPKGKQVFNLGADADPRHPTKRTGRGPAPVVQLVWERPPNKVSAGESLIAALMPLIVELRRHPGEWARLVSCAAKSSAANYRNRLGKLPEFKDIDFHSSPTPDGFAVFGRFVEDEL